MKGKGAAARKGKEVEELKKRLLALKEKGGLKRLLEKKIKETENKSEYFKKAPAQLKIDLSQKPIEKQIKILDRMQKASEIAPEYIKSVLQDPVEKQMEFWDFLARQEGEKLDKALLALKELEKEKETEELKERIRRLKKG